MPAKKTDTEDRENAAVAVHQQAQPDGSFKTVAPKAEKASKSDANAETGRDPAAPNATDAPMNYDARGDAHPMPIEPDHSPEANRPDGSEQPKSAAKPGVYDASVTRDKTPL